MAYKDWDYFAKRKTFPTAIIAVIIITVFIVFITVFLLSQNRVTSIPSYVPVSEVEEASSNTKGDVDSQFREASNDQELFLSGYRIELSNDWRNVKNVTGLKDTPFISNSIVVDGTTITNGNTAKVFYINKGDYTFYISDQLITEAVSYSEDGNLYSEIVKPQFNPNGIYLSYSSATILTADNQEFLLKKQMFTCLTQYENLCFTSGYLPFTMTENINASTAFVDFVNSIKIYEQN